MNRILKALAVVIVLVGFSAALGQDTPITPLEEIRATQKKARKLGAKGNLPMAWRQLDAHLNYAEDEGATDTQWAKIRLEAELLLNRADFLNQIRDRKNSHEELLDRFDQALLEVATLFGVDLDPVRGGTPQAEILLDGLTRVKLARTVAIDSLTLANRHLQEVVGGRVAGQDSLITALRVEVSSLRQKLWDTELRAGVAEADRSAAETVLTAKQQREEAMAALFGTLDQDEGEIVFKGDRHVVMRLSGITFPSGSAKLGTPQGVLLDKVAGAVGRFPGAKVTVEGHTDDTGGRQANLRLSRRRAETVARTLEGMLAWEAQSIATEGLGPDRPIALNSSDAGRARNRRIDLILELPE